ncbi:MAG: phosphatase domain-containing protein [Myxococcota bacterium]
MTSRISPQTPRSIGGPRPTTSPAPQARLVEPSTPRGNAFTGSVSPAPERLTGADAAAAQAKLDAISRLVSSRHVDRAEEGRILDILKSASPRELNYLVTKLDLHELVEAMDDRLVGPDNRTAFFQLLTKDRVGDLSVAARVALINGLQRGSTDGQEEAAIRDVFLATKGADLTALKNGIDAGDYRDLQQLVFHDLDDAGVQKAILDHLQAQAVPSGEAKVLSDIDDTFYVNLKDKRYPAKTVYPGVRAFYAELDRGPGAEAGRAGDLAFVTARPNDRFGAVETMTKKMLEEKGVEATVLSGDLLSNLSHEQIAEKKLENFRQYRQLYPEYGFSFLGDSGQGDVLFGLKMLKDAPGLVKGIFINDVVATPPAKRAELAAQGVHLTDTYVGAATEAFKLGLISREGLGRVVAAAKRDFEAIPFDDDAQRAARRAELDRDVAAAERAVSP